MKSTVSDLMRLWGDGGMCKFCNYDFANKVQPLIDMGFLVKEKIEHISINGEFEMNTCSVAYITRDEKGFYLALETKINEGYECGELTITPLFERNGNRVRRCEDGCCVNMSINFCPVCGREL